MEYKLSYYTVIVPSPDADGKFILLSTRTSRVLIVTEYCLSCLTQARISEIPSEIIQKLVNIKLLVPIDEDELSSIVNENKDETENDEGILYEVIQPSANCQMGCYYCGQKHNKVDFDEDLHEALIARIRNKIIAGKYNGLHIGWFGGEPLMGLKSMRQLSSKLKNIANEFNLKYSAKIVTNGLSLKSNIYRELVTDLGIKSIEVTLDGVANYHDAHRYLKSGEQTFDIIFSNLIQILSNPDYDRNQCEFIVRCNVDKKNFEGVLPLIQLLARNKIHDKIKFYATGIYSWGNDAHKGSLTKEEFAKKEIEWLREMMKLNYSVKLIPKRKKQVCMAVSSDSEVYDAFGNVFNCTEVPYVPSYEGTEYVLSSLKQNYEGAKVRPFKDWNDQLVSDRFPCHSCRMLPVCGGACPKSWYEDMRACPSAKFNIEERLKLLYLNSK